jgi:lipopolysaccharide transport system permease protein
VYWPNSLKSIKNNSYLLFLWIRRDFKGRYAGSIGGMLWAILLPLLTVLLFYMIFAVVLRMRIPELANDAGYFFYLLAGLLPWLSISEGIARATSSLAVQEQFLQKLAFPVGILPGTVVITSLIPQLVGTVIFIFLLGLSGVLSLANLLFFPLVFLCQLIMLLGIGLALSIIGIHIKDIIQFIPVFLQLLFYTAPILYPKSMVPESYHPLFLLNPLAGIIESYQSIFLGIPIDLASIVSMLFWTGILGIGGWLLFNVLKPTLGDYL